MDPDLIRALGTAGVCGAIAAILAAIIKSRTDQMANRVATDKLHLEIDEAERREIERRRKVQLDEHEEERKRTDRAEQKLKQCQDRCDHLEERYEKLREELGAAREAVTAAKVERAEALAAKRETEQLLSMRLFQCERAGLPCQANLPPPEQEQKAA